KQRHPSANGRPPHHEQRSKGRAGGRRQRRHRVSPVEAMTSNHGAARRTAAQQGHRTENAAL
ncbi:unnamed protein product, partial [Ectocarpus fasciculatus]